MAVEKLCDTLRNLETYAWELIERWKLRTHTPGLSALNRSTRYPSGGITAVFLIIGILGSAASLRSQIPTPRATTCSCTRYVSVAIFFPAEREQTYLELVPMQMHWMRPRLWVLHVDLYDIVMVQYPRVSASTIRYWAIGRFSSRQSGVE